MAVQSTAKQKLLFNNARSRLIVPTFPHRRSLSSKSALPKLPCMQLLKSVKIKNSKCSSVLSLTHPRGIDPHRVGIKRIICFHRSWRFFGLSSHERLHGMEIFRCSRNEVNSQCDSIFRVLLRQIKVCSLPVRWCLWTSHCRRNFLQFLW